MDWEDKSEHQSDWQRQDNARREWERKGAMDFLKFLGVGIVAAAIVFFVIYHPFEAKRKERWVMEVLVLEKEVADMDGEKVYLLHCEDKNGEKMTFEIAKEAMKENFDEKVVFHQIKKDKYYQFRLGAAEEFGSHYPCLCGAVTLLEGFSEEPKS